MPTSSASRSTESPGRETRVHGREATSGGLPLLVPEAVAADNDVSVRDVWDYLAHDEWQIALTLLEELGDGQPLPLTFWTPVPGHGVLRPMWDIGNSSPTGDVSVSLAGLWVEDMPVLEPGGRAAVRLHWTHVEAGQLINMHEDRSVAGTAVVLERAGGGRRWT